jgi:(R,R)-butanediol dehydrogenase/meso-butanediol dehydrogenase/diacetyl reductase
MGADVFVVDPADPIGSAERALGGKADVVFECVGVPGLIEQAVSQVRPRGTILLLGLCTRPDTFNSFAMLSKEVRLVTSAFFTVPEYRTSLDALADKAKHAAAGAAFARLEKAIRKHPA